MAKKLTRMNNLEGKDISNVYYKGGKEIVRNKKLTLAERKKLQQAEEQALTFRADIEDSI